MPFFALHCTDKPHALDLRMATRAAHLAYVRAHLDMVKLAGPLLDEAGEMAGSFFVLEVADLAAAKAFNAADPYAQAGLFGQVTLTAFRPTIGTLG
jgi:uncharacterized protein YciI